MTSSATVGAGENTLKAYGGVITPTETDNDFGIHAKYESRQDYGVGMGLHWAMMQGAHS